jgi:hypothetical protein
MRIGLVYIGQSKETVDIAQAFSSELLKKNFVVSFVNGNSERVPLSGCNYLIFIVESEKFFGKQNLESFTRFMKELGLTAAKYASIFTNKGLFADSKLHKYMKLVETQGFILHEQSIIVDKGHAEEIAKNIEPIK